MKQIFTCIALLFLGLGLVAQDPIKNFSFENWEMNTNNKLVPTDWETYDEDLDANALRKHTSGSQGSAAAYLGSYNDGSDVTGANIFIEGNLTSVPASMSFDYIVQNNTNSFINGLSIDVYFYDANGNYIEDYSWSSEMLKNNATFKNGVLNFNKLDIANAKSYEIDIYYFNFGGNINEYSVIDNIKFSNTPGNNVSVPETSKPAVTVYPNPTTGILNYSYSSNEVVSQIVVTSIDGKQISFEPNFTNSINISALAAGIYSVAIIGENDKVIGTQKVVLTK